MDSRAAAGKNARVDTDVPHAGSQSDDWLSNTAKECGCNFNPNGFENRTFSGSGSAVPPQIRSTDEILVRHRPCPSGSSGATIESAKLKIKARWLVEASRNSTSTSCFSFQMCHSAAPPNFHCLRIRISSL